LQCSASKTRAVCLVILRDNKAFLLFVFLFHFRY